MFSEELTCSTGHWADTATVVQSNWYPELPKENQTKITNEETAQSVSLHRDVQLLPAAKPRRSMDGIWLPEDLVTGGS